LVTTHATLTPGGVARYVELADNRADNLDRDTNRSHLGVSVREIQQYDTRRMVEYTIRVWPSDVRVQPVREIERAPSGP
jgi:hypothetical protein